MADSTVKYLNKLTWLRAETKKKSIVLEGSGQPALNVINAAAVSSTCIRMISQRHESGTISTPEGGAVVNGALLDSDKAFNHKNGNDEQDV